MKIFPQHPDLRLLEPEWYELVEDYCYRWQKNGVLYRITCYAGFQCDLASVPRAARSFIGHQSLGLGPPLIHDLLYACKGKITDYDWGDHEKKVESQWSVVGHPWTRTHADRLFGRQMREKGIRMWKRRSAYRMVRMFGWGAWRKTRDGDQKT